MIEVRVPVPPTFRFLSVIKSHGWRQLAPFSWGEDTATLARIHQLTSGEVVQLRMTQGDYAISIQVHGIDTLSDTQHAEIQRIVARIFSLHWQLDAFYTYLQANHLYPDTIQNDAARLLTAPTVWEEMVKTILTVNTRWAQTISMTGRFCQFGTPYPDLPGAHAFPTPGQITAYSEADFSAKVKAGYRGAYLHALATAIDNGTLDGAAWYQSALPAQTIFEQIKALKGFGDYAAGTILRLLGHFEFLAIDSECRSAYKRVTGKDDAKDKDIRAYYAPHGQWQGLVSWLDIMRD